MQARILSVFLVVPGAQRRSEFRNLAIHHRDLRPSGRPDGLGIFTVGSMLGPRRVLCPLSL